MKDIFKLQRPIASNHGMNFALVYNESLTIYEELPTTKKLVKQLFPNKELKTYWLETYNKKTKMISLTEQVEEQDW